VLHPTANSAAAATNINFFIATSLVGLVRGFSQAYSKISSNLRSETLCLKTFMARMIGWLGKDCCLILDAFEKNYREDREDEPLIG
jgi:hypothetical protein